MLSFITANLATVIVGAVVFAIIAAVTVKLIRDEKRHSSSCGGCSGCSCGCGNADEGDCSHHG